MDEPLSVEVDVFDECDVVASKRTANFIVDLTATEKTENHMPINLFQI